MPTSKYLSKMFSFKLINSFTSCHQVNCRGYNAFGRRRRSVEENSTDVAVSGDLLSGQLREEITIQSNAILTFEKREERSSDPREGKTIKLMTIPSVLTHNF